MEIDGKFLIGLILGLFVVPAIFMLVWNVIITDVCGFSNITYWQSFFLGIGVRAINGSIGIKARLDNE